MWYHTIELGVEPNFSVVEISVVRGGECRVWGLGFGTSGYSVLFLMGLRLQC